MKPSPTDAPEPADAALDELPELVRRSVALLDSLETPAGGDIAGPFVVLQDPEIDKYSFPDGVTIDCGSLIQLCRAACCRLPFPLSRQDIVENKLRWDARRPYMIRRRHDGYCDHLDAASHACLAYDIRPVPCRAFDCRADRRIWLDFEQRKINPDAVRIASEKKATIG